MAGISVGSVSVDVVPSVKNFARELRRNLVPQATEIGKRIGENIRAGIRDGLGDPLEGPLDESSRKQERKAPKQGDQVAGAFAKGFQRRLKAAFESLPKAEIDADSTPADRKVSELRARLEALSDQTIGVDLDAGEALARMEEIRGELDSLAGAGATVDVRADVAAALGQLEAVQAEVERLDGETVNIKVDKSTVRDTDRLSASLARVASGARSTGVAFRSFLKFSVITGGLITVAGGAAAAAGSLVQLSAALAPVAGLAVGIPAVIASAVIAFGTLKLALSGVGDAFKAALGTDTAKFQESLKGLAPAARSVAVELRNVRPQLVGIRKAAQEAFFGPLRGQIAAVAKVLAGPMREGVRLVATEWGLAAREVAIFARSALAVRATQTLFGSVAFSIGQIRPALRSVLAGFTALAVAVAPTLRQLAVSAGQVAARFGVWLQQLAASGRAAQILDAALVVVRQIGVVLANVAGIIKSVFAAAAGAGSGLLGTLGQLTGQLNTFLKSAQGQTALQGLFAGLAAIGRALTPVLQAIVRGIGAIAPAVGRLAAQIGPVLTTAINALGPALAALEPGISALIQGLGQGIAQIAPLLVPVGQALSGIAVALAPVLPLAGRLVAQLVTGLLPVVRALTPVISIMVGAIGQILDSVAPILPVLGQLIASLLTGLTPVLRQVTGTITQSFGIIARALIQVVQQSGPAITQIVVAVASLIPPLLPLVPLFANLLAAILPILPPLIQLAAVLVGALVPVLRVVITVIVAVVTTLGNLLLPVIRATVTVITVMAGVVGPIFHGIGVALHGLSVAAQVLGVIFKVAFGAIILLARILVAVIVTVMIAPILIAFNLWKAVLLALWRSAIQPVFSAIASAGRGLASALTPVWSLILRGIRSVGNGATWLYRNAVVPAWNGIKSAISTAYNATIKPVLSALNSFLRGPTAATFRWISNTIIKPLWIAVGVAVQLVWTQKIKPAFDALKSGVGKVKSAFSAAVSGIKSIWKGLESATKKPVQFVINTVYNSGIRKAWNLIAGLVKLPQLPSFTFAAGGVVPGESYGVLPGYAPGRDTMLAAVSPGEGWIRPDATRGLGSGFIHGVNAAAARMGASGAARFASQYLSGGGQAFGLGGIVDKIKGAVGGAKDLVVKGASNLLAKGASFAARKILDPILSQIGKLGGGSPWGRAMASLPRQMVDKFIEWLKKTVDPKLSSGGNAGAVKAARAYIGTPYVWGGTSHSGIDCSGLTMRAWLDGAHKNITRTTGTQRNYLQTIPRPKPGAAGQPHPGHTYLASRVEGGKTWVVEAAHSGTRVSEHLLTRSTPWWGYPPGMAAGGIVDKSLGRRFVAGTGSDWKLAALLGLAGDPGGVAGGISALPAHGFDAGGYLPAGPSLVYNGTGRPEPVLTGRQLDSLTSAAAGGGRTVNVMPNSTVYVQDPTDVDALAQRTEFAARSATF